MNNYFVTVNMPTTSGRKKSKNFYPGLVLADNLLVNKYLSLYRQVANNIGEETVVLDNIFDTIETEDNIILKKGKLSCIVLENDRLKFSENWEKELIFDKNTLSACDIENFDEFIPFQQVDISSLQQIYKYITSVSSLNENVYNFFVDNGDAFVCYDSWSKNISDRLQSIIYNISYAFSGVEKMINAGQDKLLVKNFKERDFKLINNTKKLSQSVGLPAFALPIIKKLRLEASMNSISTLASMVDGNSLKILLELIDNYSSFVTSKNLGSTKERDVAFTEFFNCLSQIMDKGYKLLDTLNYILRQRMYWSRDNVFGFPFEDTKLFLDYLELNKNNSLQCEKYPQNLQKMHDILIQNLKDFDESKNDNFKAAVAKYSKYENEFKKDGYCFIVPKDIRALIQEGNNLHHCIGSYVDKIISGESRIIFMRSIEEKNTSFVTIEINEDCDITEIKGIYNKEPEPEIIAIANKWAGTCKRLK